jgi:hypothetical protein
VGTPRAPSANTGSGGSSDGFAHFAAAGDSTVRQAEPIVYDGFQRFIQSKCRAERRGNLKPRRRREQSFDTDDPNNRGRSDTNDLTAAARTRW